MKLREARRCREQKWPLDSVISTNGLERVDIRSITSSMFVKRTGPVEIVAYQNERHAPGQMPSSQLGPHWYSMIADWLAARVRDGAPQNEPRYRYITFSGKVEQSPLPWASAFDDFRQAIAGKYSSERREASDEVCSVECSRGDGSCLDTRRPANAQSMIKIGLVAVERRVRRSPNAPHGSLCPSCPVL